MKIVLFLTGLIGIAGFGLMFKGDLNNETAPYTVYQHASTCKAELGIKQALPVLSCLDGKQVPIFVDRQEIKADNWERLLAQKKKCDNPHWLGGDMGCWTYSHLQVFQLDEDNVMVLNCRQKGQQAEKNWFRQTRSNLGLNQAQRKAQFEQAPEREKKELYYLYSARPKSLFSKKCPPIF